MAIRDSQRIKVYRAEQSIRKEHGGEHFASIEQAQRYADRLLSTPWFKRTFPELTMRVYVKPARAKNKATAHWESNYITLPRGWGMQKIILLHELAHFTTEHMKREIAGHGPQFVRNLLVLVREELGEAAYDALFMAYARNGVRIAALPARDVAPIHVTVDEIPVCTHQYRTEYTQTFDKLTGQWKQIPRQRCITCKTIKIVIG